MTDFALNPSQTAGKPTVATRNYRKGKSVCRFGYALFLLLNVILFVRPTDIFEGFQGAPIYEGLILLCLAASLPALLPSLTPKALAGNPALTCVIGLLPAIVLASLSHLQLWWARSNGVEFLKVLIYFVLLLSLVNSKPRLDRFLKLLIILTASTAFLSLLTYDGILELEALKPVDQHMGFDDAGDVVSVPRLVGPGIFNDPNDFSIILVSGLVLCWKFLQDGKHPLRYPLLAASATAMAFAFILTRSRGGFLSLIAAGTVLLIGRYGWKRASLVCGVLLPVVFIFGAGRQTDINLEGNDTAQGRIHLWRDSLVLFHQAPIFGIGGGQLAEINQLVAHNSFVQVFAELGIVGGLLFMGALYVPVYSLIQQCRPKYRLVPSRPNHLAIALLAMLLGYLVGLYSLTRIYTVSTYVILGIAIAGTRLLAIDIPETRLIWNKRLGLNMLLVGLGTLLWLEAFVRFLVV